MTSLINTNFLLLLLLFQRKAAVWFKDWAANEEEIASKHFHYSLTVGLSVKICDILSVLSFVYK